MNVNEFHKQLADSPMSFRRSLRDYLRHPTERNACYIAGYVAALGDARLFKTEDAANYWWAVIGRTERMPDVGEKLIAEMDSPPAATAQAALEAAREQQKENARQITHCGIMNWIRMSDRKPTVDDADEAGHVWVYDKMFADVSSVRLYQTDFFTHWMPKEKRPAPPAPKGEQQ